MRKATNHFVFNESLQWACPLDVRKKERVDFKVQTHIHARREGKGKGFCELLLYGTVCLRPI